MNHRAVVNSRRAAVHQPMPPKQMGSPILNLMLNFTDALPEAHLVWSFRVFRATYMSQERHRAAYMQLEESARKFHCLALQSQF